MAFDIFFCVKNRVVVCIFFSVTHHQYCIQAMFQCCFLITSPSSFISIRGMILSVQFIFSFFLSGFSFTNIHDSQNSRGRVRLSL